MPNHTSIIASNFLLTRSLYPSTITLHVPNTAQSATLTTSPGTRFVDGSTSKTITGYITVSPSLFDSNIWAIQDIFPYSKDSNDYSKVGSLAIGSTLQIRSTISVYGHTDSIGDISTIGTLTTSALTRQSQPLSPIFGQSNLNSTFNGLGNIYVSSGTDTVTPVFLELTSYGYISSLSFQSTVAGLATNYISAPSLTSTIIGTSNYLRQSDLVNTQNGLGSNYITRDILLSTTSGLSNIYVLSSVVTSTVSGLLSLEQSNLISTVMTLGSNYISSLTLQSTVRGLGTFGYISYAQVNEYVDRFRADTINSNFIRMVNTLSLGSNGYISTSQLTSTVSGLPFFLPTYVQRLGYISTSQLFSTVDTLGYTYVSSLSFQSTIDTLQSNVITNLTSTCVGLGSSSYISTENILSTVSGLSNTYASNLASNTFSGINGTSPTYTSIDKLISTVNTLGYSMYVSTTSFTSSIIGYSNAQEVTLSNLVNNPDSNYIIRPNLISTTSNLLFSFSNQFISTLNGLGTANYISLNRLTSNVENVTGDATLENLVLVLNNPTSTDTIPNAIQGIIDSAALFYTIRPQLISTTSGLLSNFTSTFTSTLSGLGCNYISSGHLVSSVTWLRSNFVINSLFISTTQGYSNAQLSNLQYNMMSNPGSNYIVSVNLLSTNSNLITLFSNQLLSTTTGLCSVNYISIPQLTSTVAGLGWNYISVASLTSTLTSYTNNYSLQAIQSFENNLGNTYISTGGIISTVTGLSNTYITRSNLTSSIAGLGRSYISTPSLTSTITGNATPLSNTTRSILQSTVAGLGQLYISTLLPLSFVKVANFPPFTNIAGTITWSNSRPLFPSGYVSVRPSTALTNTYNLLSNSSNFYDNNESTSILSIPMVVSLSTIAISVRTFGYGSNYLYGDGTYLTITSDSNAKHDIQPISSASALDQITSLRGVYYKKIGENQTYIGCIAQEVEPIFPEVITTHPSTEPKDLKSMKYETLLAPLVESVKELAYTHSTLKYFVQKKYKDLH